MAINDERDHARSRMDIDDIVERDSSSSVIVMIVLVIAVVLSLYVISELARDVSAGAPIAQPNISAVPHA